MPNIYFLIFEFIIYLQLALCLRHAWKQGRRICFGSLRELYSAFPWNWQLSVNWIFMNTVNS